MTGVQTCALPICFIANLALPDDGGLVNKILSYGGAVKVLQPPELKIKLSETAKKIAASY